MLDFKGYCFSLTQPVTEVIRLPFNYQKITFFKIPTALDLRGLQSISKDQLPKLPFFDGSTLNGDSLWGSTLAGRRAHPPWEHSGNKNAHKRALQPTEIKAFSPAFAILLSSNLYASAIFKALIIQGFLRFWGIEKPTMGTPSGAPSPPDSSAT
ncbi:hypothetical protein QCL51_09405 [Pseudomonas sp. LTR0]|uniref:hypothetical protein n=1 Tax=Pseudomonas sp. LTR0 TaxID=3040601 RepID=UPI0030D194EE